MTVVRRSERLRELIRRRGVRRRWEAIITMLVIAIAIVVPTLVAPRAVRWLQAKREQADAPESPLVGTIQFGSRRDSSIRIDRDRWSDMGLSVATATACPPPPPMKMDGVLYLDPDDFVLVRSRFQGEVVELPTYVSASNNSVDSQTSGADATNQAPYRNTLRFGDQVKKGDLLCVIWSRELGEKKSEMAQLEAQLSFDRTTLKRLQSVGEAVPQRQVQDAERRVREAEISLDKIVNTLRSWQLTESEIDQIHEDVRQASNQLSQSSNESQDLPAGATPIDPLKVAKLKALAADASLAKVDRWARLEIRSPIDGTIVEKDVTAGMLIGIDDALYKIANLSHLDVRAFAYEEDLSTLQRLDRSLWKWSIQLHGDPQSKLIDGQIDRIGSLIDPLQHTGLVMGWVDNRDGSLRPGQFVTASVPLPIIKPMISVPSISVVDVDGTNYVLLQTGKDEFIPVPVHVDRFQENMACIEPKTNRSVSTDAASADLILSKDHLLQLGSHVIATGAVEIMAEYQAHLRTLPSEAMTVSEQKSSPSGADEPMTPDSGSVNHAVESVE